jgi:hypothetical protein
MITGQTAGCKALKFGAKTSTNTSSDSSSELLTSCLLVPVRAGRLRLPTVKVRNFTNIAFF